MTYTVSSENTYAPFQANALPLRVNVHQASPNSVFSELLVTRTQIYSCIGCLRCLYLIDAMVPHFLTC